MTILVALATLLLIAAVAWIVSAPLRHKGRSPNEVDAGKGGRAALEAAKEAKYREIRDAELDYRTGKLSEEDFQALDRQLRAQAVAILHELDRYPV